MTPLHFEQTYQAEWAELEALIDRTLGRKNPNESADRAAGKVPDAAAVRAARAIGRISRAERRATAAHDRVRLAALYRRACEQLALARARAYPAYIVDRLERVTAAAHQLIYHRREFRFAQLRDLALVAFPRSVRAHWPYVAVSAAAFMLPTIVIGLLVYWRPDFILSILSQETASQFEQMYSPTAQALGRRTASTDWMMFGYYIRNNIGVSFQCFAGGLFAGVGSLFFLAWNGAFGGAIAGYLTERGLSSTFYSFVATHSSFELTAIILSGAAGLRIGHALLAPGRQTRRQSLVIATTETSVLLYGVTVMLIVAAAIEAFWSSAQWLPLPLKYGVAALCWTAVIAFFVRQGRHEDAVHEAGAS